MIELEKIRAFTVENLHNLGAHWMIEISLVMVDGQKAEAMAAKRRKARVGISFSSEEEDKSNTRDNMYPNQANDEYPLQL